MGYYPDSMKWRALGSSLQETWVLWIIKVKLNGSETCKVTEETVLQKTNCLHPITNELHTFSSLCTSLFWWHRETFRLPMLIRLPKKFVARRRSVQSVTSMGLPDRKSTLSCCAATHMYTCCAQSLEQLPSKPEQLGQGASPTAS